LSGSARAGFRPLGLGDQALHPLQQRFVAHAVVEPLRQQGKGQGAGPGPCKRHLTGGD